MICSEATVKGKQETGAREATLGELHTAAPLLRASLAACRAFTIARGPRKRRWESPHPSAQMASGWEAGPGGKDNEADITLLCCQDKDPVKIADVVANEHHGTLGRTFS